jgi:hypothetical protein
MKHFKINSENKEYIVKRYTDYILSRIDNLEVWEGFKEYFYKEKLAYPNETLEQEINRYCPSVLEDHIAEDIVGKGREYAKTI